MSKPSIGDAITPTMEEEQKQERKELTVLDDDSRESIYYQVFFKTDNESA